MNTYRYTCDGFRTIRGPITPEEAARTFAGRLARARYGRTGSIRLIRLDSHTPDFTLLAYDCFVGTYDRRRGVFTGANTRIVIRRETTD